MPCTIFAYVVVIEERERDIGTLHCADTSRPGYGDIKVSEQI